MVTRAIVFLVFALSTSAAIAGSVYTPPAAASGVSGDGTGVTDAGAFRTALSLGTAATVNTGIVMGEVWMGPFLAWSGNISDMFNSTGTEGRFSFGRLIGTSGTSVTSHRTTGRSEASAGRWDRE